MAFTPEQHFIPPNKHSPNSVLPVLIYRDVLPLPLSQERTTSFLEANGWVKQGVWGHIPVRHFHPNTHECYGIFQGESTLLLGCGANDTTGGVKLNVSAGDVIVIPAGTAHCSLQSSLDYRYVGVYPKGAPHWRNEYGRDPVDPDGSVAKEIQSVEMPLHDPVNGENGPLTQLWRNIKQQQQQERPTHLRSIVTAICAVCFTATRHKGIWKLLNPFAYWGYSQPNPS